MIRNEPFAYYAVKSVYDYADAILLYDTGSDDPIALDGVARLIKEDTQGKIKFKPLQIADASQWVATRRATISAPLGALRQQQINDTQTEFFLLVDGDEVHYREGIQKIVEEIIPNWPPGKESCYLPVRWHSDLYQFIARKFAPSFLQGRLFHTEGVFVKGAYPTEMHCSKSTGRILWKSCPESFIITQIPSFVHFEPYLKPRRRTIDRGRRRFRGPLPEVMGDDTFIKRYQDAVQAQAASTGE